MGKLLFISELYYPEETSTGYFVTGIAEGIAERLVDQVDISVLCSQPTYSKAGLKVSERETRGGVEIHRLGAPKGDKNRLLGRLWNLASLSVRFFFRMGREIHRGDVVVVLTNPPSLPLFAAFWGRLKGAKIILLVHDVYPDVLVPTGLARENSFLVRSIDVLQRWMLRRMERVVVLGRDMQLRLAAKMPGRESRIEIIPNWGEAQEIDPGLHATNPLRKQWGLDGKFVIQFSGNLGRTHGLEDLFELACSLKDNEGVHFLVFGWGAGKAWLEEQILEEALRNVTVLPPCEREELAIYLTCCDLFLMPFKKGMEGISVPSRLYNVLAAGNPVLAVADLRSELAQVVLEEEIGWVVEPGDVEGMIKGIEEARSDLEALKSIRVRARKALEQKYTRERVLERWEPLIREGLNR